MSFHRSRYRRPRLRRRGSLTPPQIGAAIVAGLALAGYAHASAAHGSHTAAATTTAADAAVAVSPGGGTLGCAQLEQLWEEAGGSPSAAFLAAEEARAESGGDPDATDDDGNGTVDRGLWQINSIWGPESTYSALGNARAAVAISHDGTNWTPWVSYQRGLEASQC